MNRLRVLVLGPDCNPEQVSIHVCFFYAAALAQLHDVTLAVRAPSEEPVRRAQAPFCTIEVVLCPGLIGSLPGVCGRVFKYNYRTQVLTAFIYPFSVAFEWDAWRRLRPRIFAGDFDVVLRVCRCPGLSESFRFLPADGTYTFRDWAA